VDLGRWITGQYVVPGREGGTEGEDDDPDAGPA
jgi:endogenous inhibitor of DNA gyrase (YacG/DUF329 family)